MDARAGAAEEAVVAAALARGLLTPAQIDNARRAHVENVRAGLASSLLALLARHLRPEHRDELRKVYATALEASGTEAEAADAEATSLLDMPALARPASETLAPEPVRLSSPGTFFPVSSETLAPSGRAPITSETLAPSGRAPVSSETLAPGARVPAPVASGARPSSSAPAMHATYMEPQPAATVRADKHVTYMDPPTVAQQSSGGAQVAGTLIVGPPDALMATKPPRPPAGAPVTEVAGFTIVRELGRGGMGVVYEATHPTHGPVALKVLISGDMATGQDVDRFKLEARSAASMSHKNIVRVYEHGQDAAGNWFMAMELIKGESLEGVVRREGALQPLAAARISRDVAHALAAAHAKSILHRDVKPHNVLMDGDTPRLTDFGLAKLVGDAKSRSLTSTGGVLGTPGYMAPEQAGGEGKKIDKRADVYGVGSLLYHLLTGRAPFEGDSLANVLVAVLQKAPTPLTERRPGLPRDLETICFKCLEKKPADRYQSAKELADDLERFIGAQEIKARPPGMFTLALRAARAHGAAAAVALLGGLALAIGVVLAVRAQLPPSGGPIAATTSDAPPTPPTETPVRVDRPVVPPPPPPRVTESTHATNTESTTTESTTTESTHPTTTESTLTPPTTTTESPPPRATESTPPTTTTESTPPRATESTEPSPRTTEPTPPRPDPIEPTPTPRVADVRPPALDERTVKWLDWRCRVRRQARSMGVQGANQLHWARNLRTAVAEARARNVPLVVMFLNWGDDFPPFIRERTTVDLLNAEFVVLLAQKEKQEESKGEHEQILVGGESRCGRQLMTTCRLHDEARLELKDDDRDESLFPGGRHETRSGENYRFIVWVPGTTTLNQLSNEPERSGLPPYTDDAMVRALRSAKETMGPPRFPLSALEVFIEADKEADEREFKHAIDRLKGVESRPGDELMRAYARHQLEVGLQGKLTEMIDVALALPSAREVKSALQKLRRDIGRLPGYSDRVDEAIKQR